MRSHSQPNEPTLFPDRSLGKHVVADRLRKEGIKVEVHDDHLPIDAPDEDWIALVAERGWVAITKDKRLRYRAAEIRSVRENAARLIVIRAKNATGSVSAGILVKGYRRISRFAARRNAPFVAAIYRDGRVLEYPIT